MIKKLFSAAVLAVQAAGASALVPPELPGGSVAVPAGVSEISVEAGDMVTVMLERSAAPEARALFSTRGRKARPVAMRVEGSRLVVEVSGRDERQAPAAGPVTTVVRLRIPAGRDVSVKGKNLVVSGDVAARSFSVEARSVSMHFLKIAAGTVSVRAGHGQLKFRLDGARSLLVSAAEATGRIIAPARTKVDGLPAGVELVRRTAE